MQVDDDDVDALKSLSEDITNMMLDTYKECIKSRMQLPAISEITGQKKCLCCSLPLDMCPTMTIKMHSLLKGGLLL